MVVMDKGDYIRKAKELLRQPTYKSIPTDPTNKYKYKLILSLLKTIKTDGGINDVISRRLYPTGAGFPQGLWVTQGAEERDATQTHGFQHRCCDI